MFTSLSAGEYGAKITDANGCSYTVSFDIDQPTELSLVVVDRIDENCENKGELILHADGGTPPYSYTASAGTIQGNRIIGLSAGNVTVRVTDSNGCLVDSMIAVVAIPCGSDLNEDNLVTPEDTPLSGNVLDNDQDGGSFTITRFVVGGDTTTATPTGGTYVIPGIGDITIESDGDFTFTPAPGYNGDVPEITYLATNGVVSGQTNLNITILPVDDFPTAIADTSVVDEDTPVSGDLAINDTISEDGGNIWTVVNQPDSGSVVVNNNGTYTYIPDPDFNGVDSFVYMLCDVNGTCDTAVVSLTINPVNDRPIIEDDDSETLEDSPVVFNIISNDIDIDGNIDPGTIDLDPGTPGQQITITISNEGVYLVDTITGDLTFTPDSNFYGETTSITYEVCDDGTPVPAECGTANITIEVIPVNDPPIAGIDTMPSQLNPGGTNTILVQANTFSGTDVDGSIAFVRIETLPDSVTSIIVDGVVYTTIPVGGIDVATTPSGQPLFDIEIDPVDGVAEVMLEYLVIDNEGAASLAAGSVTIPFNGISVVGTVFSDNDGLIDNTVDGVGTNHGGDLYMNLVNDLNQVVASVPVENDGAYAITEADGLTLDSEFKLILTNGVQSVGTTLSEATYPAGLTSTGENIGVGAGSDGTVDGILAINTNTGSLADVNFGVTGEMDADAGDDAQICSSEGSYTLSTATANNYTSLRWSTNGTGTFDDATALNSVYAPSEADIRTGEVQLTLTAYGNGTITTMDDMMVLTLWPQAEADAGPDAEICWGETFVLTGSTTKNFNQLTWSSSDAGASFDNVNSLHPTYTPSSSGIATITLTASGLGNCSDTIISMDLTVADEIVLAAPVVTDANCDSNEDGTVQLGVTSGGVGTITYSLSTGESNTSGLFANLAAGGYIYTVSDDNGCSVSSSFRVDDPNELELTVLEENDNICYNAENGTARVVASGGTLPYTFDWNGVVVPAIDDSVSLYVNLPAGIYVVTVTDGQGCKEIETLEVEQPDSLNIWLVDLIEPNCDASGEVLVTGYGGVAPYTYSSTAGTVTANKITGLTSGLVTVTITDANACSNNIDITLTDDDITPPAYTCAVTVSQGVDAGNCSANITLVPPVALDNCNGTNIIMQFRVIEPNNSISGIVDTATTTMYNFMVGISRVEWTITDQSGNSSECVQLVEVIEDENPIITCAANATFNNTVDECGYVVPDNSIDAVATDNCSIESLTHNYGAWSNPLSLEGAIFPVGATDVVWTAEDAAGNVVSCTTVITVNDTQLPEFVNCPDGDTLTIALFSSACEGTAIWSIPIASDNCSGVEVIQTAGPERGSPIPTGFYDVVYTATDTSGNSSTCTFTIEVIDTDDPIAVCPSDFHKDNDEGVCSWTAPANSISPLLVTSNCPYEVLYDVSGVTTANGNDDASGTTFNLGTSIVTYTINDTVNNQSWTCDFRVVVSDKEAPVVTCPDPISEENDAGLCSNTIALVLPTFTENCNADAVNISYRVFEPDNSVKEPFASTNNSFEFKIGVSQVEWFVSDEAGNVSTCMQEVTIFEIEDPVISCPATSEFIFDANPALCGVVIDNTDLDATATENCGEFTMSHNYGDWALQNTMEGAFFPVGSTDVTWTATDVSGNTSSCTITVTVNDAEIPEFVNCPSNTTFTVGLFADACRSGSIWSIPVANDNCSQVAVTQIDGPSQGEILPVGLYPITYQATDEAGNITTCSFSINVVDTEDPVIVCQPNITVKSDQGQCSWASPLRSLTPLLANSNCPATVTWMVEANNGNKIYGSNDVSGYEFELGTTKVTYYIVEVASGQNWKCSFTVTVEDEEAPIIDCQPTLEIIANAGECSSVVDLIPPVSSDNCAEDLNTYFRVFGPDNSTGDLIEANNSTFEFQNGISRVEWLVMDAAGNESRCWQDVWVSPDVDALIPDAGENSSICETDNSFATDATAPEYVDIMWTTSGTGSFADPTQVNTAYLPSVNDIDDGFVVLTITSSIECATTSDQMLLRITHPPLVSAGEDAIICENTDYQLYGTLINNASAVVWSTLGSGTLSNKNIFNPVYTPGEADIEAGKVELVFRGISGSTCEDELDTMTLFIDRLPVVEAGDDAWICEGESLTLTEATLQHSGSIEWSTNGSGTFEDITALQAVYNPSVSDVVNGTVVLTLSVTNDGECDVVSVEMTLNISKTPSVYAGENRSTCFNQEIQINGATANNYETLVWTTNGAGTIENAETLSPAYVPADGETGIVILTLTITSGPGCQSVMFSDELELDILPPLIVDVGEDQTIHSSSVAKLSVNVVNGSGSYFYKWEPEESVTDPNSNYTKTIQLLGTTTFEVTVIDDNTGCIASDELTVKVEQEAAGVVSFYRGFSPNKDGVNDTWTIKGIENFPDNKVMIFNRWGDKVRHLENYNNTSIIWDGTNEKGEDLPDGTYYYLVELENVDEFTGWVHIRTDR